MLGRSVASKIIYARWQSQNTWNEWENPNIYNLVWPPTSSEKPPWIFILKLFLHQTVCGTFSALKGKWQQRSGNNTPNPKYSLNRKEVAKLAKAVSKEAQNHRSGKQISRDAATQTAMRGRKPTRKRTALQEERGQKAWNRKLLYRWPPQNTVKQAVIAV